MLGTASGSRRRQYRLSAVAAGIIAGLTLGLLGGRHIWDKPPSPMPVFHQITFRRGTIWSARFAPDGQTVIYGAAWEGRPLEPFLTRLGSPESRPQGFPGTEILSISSSGQMAISLNRRFAGGWSYTGMLVRVPLAGGAPPPSSRGCRVGRLVARRRQPGHRA